MIKGIYNENEFYNNFYWDNKFQDELRNKSSNILSFADGTTKLKELDQLFWAMLDASKAGIKSQDTLTGFYQEVFKALGYKVVSEKRDTQDGKQYTLFVNEELKGSPELFGILVDENETGLFESQVIALTSSEEMPVEDREISELLQEELLESEKPPKWVFVGSHNALFIIERNKWSFGRFIKIEWQEVFLQRDIKPYEVIWGLASKAMLCPETGSSSHEEFDDNSHRHAFEVTTELRESVRESIELLINEMIYARKEARQGYLNKEEEAAIYAKELSHDALFYVYRLIFLLYLEAQGDDSDLLPLKSEIYRMGYSLEKLLELDYVTIMPNTPDYDGSFLQESLDKIFSLIYSGFNPTIKEDLLRKTFSGTGFLVKGIKSDLFNPDITKHLKGIKLRNGVLQLVLIKLSLTRVQARGRAPRSRVSYANLGINQLGAVYEGLLSYSGFFAQEELHALKPTSVKQSDIDNGKELDQVYLAPKSLVEKYRTTKEKKYNLTDDNVVLDESGNPKIYKKGSFIYRLAGRDRQKLASFYTPESLTKCTVKYSLKVLFENKKTLKDLWGVKILEPAMGSGAFLNEAVNQISDRILELEVRENVGDLKTPKDKQKRLWEIKSQLISQNVYGVDLNPTAIELARFSLWLNCIGAGKEPPQFGGRLKVGNSLIGARFKKGADGIYPWLLLDDGMMNYGKRLKDYDADQYDNIHAFRKDLIYSKLESSHDKVKTIQIKAEGVLKELITSKDADKKQIAYERLKLCGDLWCSTFFLVGDDLKNFPAKHESLCDVFASILENGHIHPKLKAIVEEKYNSERFFHWDIEFPEIIAASGFDLILGNPPWMALEWQDSLYISDINPIPVTLDLNAAQTREFIDELGHFDHKIQQLLFSEYVKVSGYSSLLETDFYSILKGISKNTYKAFDLAAFHLISNEGVIGMIHEDALLEDKKAESVRELIYKRLRFHFQFQNERKLFSEIHNRIRFSINVFGHTVTENIFSHIGNLFLPSTIEGCFSSNGTEPLPRVKLPSGGWDLTGHKDRIINIDLNVLKTFGSLQGTNETAPQFLNLHSKYLLSFIDALALNSIPCSQFVGQEMCIGSVMMDQTAAQDDKMIVEKSTKPNRLEELIYSGPHLYSYNPFFQETAPVAKSNRSYVPIDLSQLEQDYIIQTSYKLLLDEKKLDSLFPTLQNRPYRSYFRLATRGMINPANERSMFLAIIPPGTLHVNSLRSLAVADEQKIAVALGFGASILIDGYFRLKNKINIFTEDLKSFPIGKNAKYYNSIARRALALNGLTKAYERLWLLNAQLQADDTLTNNRKLTGYGEKFNSKNTIRTSTERRLASCEIDALVALSFDISCKSLIEVYETLFPVMYEYDQKDAFDRIKVMELAYRHFAGRGW